MPDAEKRMDRFCKFIVKRRLAVLIAVVTFTIIFASGAARIKSDVILQDLFPYNHSYLKLYARFVQVFGSGASTVIIAVQPKHGDIFNKDTLTKIKDMTNEIELWDEVYRALTVSMASNSVKVAMPKARGEIAFGALMFPDIPKTGKEMDLLKKHIFSTSSINGKLVSEDGTAALIMTEFKENISYEKSFEILQSLVKRYSDENTLIHITGYPMLMGWIYSYKSQMALVFSISIALMVIILYVVFRNITGMIAPIALALICSGLGLGFIGWTGLNFSPLLYVLAFLVGARMLSNAVQITHRYIEEFRSTMNRKEAAYRTMRAMWMPNVAAVATDAVGFMVLATAKIFLMQQIAIMMGFWMMTIAISGMMVPIICSFLPIKADKVENRNNGEGLARINTKLAEFSIGPGKYHVGIIVLIILVVGIWQTTRLKVGDPSPGSPILWPDHTYNQDTGFINKTFKFSSDNIALYYEGAKDSVYDPEVPRIFEKFDQHMAKELPDIYKSSSSFLHYGKTINMLYHDGDPTWFQLSRNEELLTGTLGIMRARVGSATLRRFVDGSCERAQIMVFFADHTSDNMLRVKNAAYDFFKEHPMKTKNGEFKLAGGRIGLEIALNEEMKRSHAVMDTLVLVTILIMCSLAFRSFVAGAMLALPLILSNLIAFSYMAWANIGLSPNTLPCSAVGVGVGVDFAIYLYSRCIEEFPRHDSWSKTVIAAVRTAGNGIVFTGITLILPIIPWSFISELKFQAQMGFFLAMLLFINMLGALVLHPLLIVMIKPKFMKRRVSI